MGYIDKYRYVFYNSDVQVGILAANGKERSDFMPFVPAPNVVAISISGLLGGVPVTLTLEVELAGAPTTTDLDNIASITSGWLTSWYKPIATDDLTWTVIDCVDQSSNIGNLGKTYPISITGNVTGDPPEPANVAVLISKKTALRGKSYSGRTFLCGQGEGSSAGAHYLTTGAIAAWGTAYANWITALRAASYNPVVVSRYTGGNPRTTAVTTPIETTVCQALMASQRGRLGR